MGRPRRARRPHRDQGGHHRRTARRPGRGPRGRRLRRERHTRRRPGGAASGHHPLPGGRPDGQLPQPRQGFGLHRRHSGHLLPQGVRLGQRTAREDRPPRAREVPRLRGGTRPRHGRDPARGHRRRGAGPAALRRRPCPDQRRQRPRRPADQDPVLREQVLSDLHADGAVPGPAGARGLRPSAEPAAAAVGQRRVAPGPHAGRHDRTARRGAHRARPFPDPRPGRPAADRHSRRHGPEGPAQADREDQCVAVARGEVEGVLQGPGQEPLYLRDGDLITATIATPDGQIDLGEQRTPVTDAP